MVLRFTRSTLPPPNAITAATLPLPPSPLPSCLNRIWWHESDPEIRWPLTFATGQTRPDADVFAVLMMNGTCSYRLSCATADAGARRHRHGLRTMISRLRRFVSYGDMAIVGERWNGEGGGRGGREVAVPLGRNPNDCTATPFDPSIYRSS